MVCAGRRSAGSYKKAVEGQLVQYLPVLILLGVAVAFAAGNLMFPS